MPEKSSLYGKVSKMSPVLIVFLRSLLPITFKFFQANDVIAVICLKKFRSENILGTSLDNSTNGLERSHFPSSRPVFSTISCVTAM